MKIRKKRAAPKGTLSQTATSGTVLMWSSMQMGSACNSVSVHLIGVLISVILLAMR